MATRKISLVLRRLSRSYHSLRPLQSCVLLNPNFPPSSNLYPNNQVSTLIPISNSLRYFSSGSWESELSNSSDSLSSVTKSELGSNLTEASGIPGSNVGDVIANSDYILPIRAFISMLDGIHDSTGLPWWITIVSSTVLLRLSLFPFRVFQLHKIIRIHQCAPKLPSAFPAPFSEESIVEHFSKFRRERKAIGCPSYLWNFAFIPVQVTSFILGMASLRRMCMSQYVGFDTGGTLWFHNLNEFSQGGPGLIFPTLLVGLHLLNYKISFGPERAQSGMYGLIDKFYRIYVKAVTVPIFCFAFIIPHGCILFWVTNLSVTIIQHLSFRNNSFKEKLGLSPRQIAESAKDHEISPESKTSESLNTPRNVPVKDLSPKELLSLSVLSLSRSEDDKALRFLRLALKKDPEYVRALTVLGQTLLQKKQEVEATKYFERAIAKLTRIRMPTEVEDVDLLIQALQWGGVGYIRQGKMIEGKALLERMASMEEPEDVKSKAHYYDGITFLAGTLLNEGRKAEAIAYLERAAAYNSSYKDYLEQCKNDSPS